MAMRPWFRWRRDRPLAKAAPVFDALLAEAARSRDYASAVEWVRAALRWIGQDVASPRDEAGIGRAHARVRFLFQRVARGTQPGHAGSTLAAGLLGDPRTMAWIDLLPGEQATQLARRGGPN